MIDLVRILRTPSDFHATMTSQEHVVNRMHAPAQGESERRLRRALSEIFDDLSLIGSDEPSMVTAYLEGIEEPLREVSDLGFNLVGIVSTGTATFSLAGKPHTFPNWRRCTYIVASDPAFYRVDRPDAPLEVHRLGVDCDGASALAFNDDPNYPVRSWGSVDHLRAAFEGSVPWCPTCEMAALAR